ncbi:glycosyltransferase family 2 protein [Pelagicoccus albus]|uniref:Glycosyltransferase n=1 Tax=Pelagicoccus albus TaxID=415222 RepID=A0A7X1E910_9BACT|nr:glycosyltransferase [Pelagicoccus albus]MBC2606708.1 glycosyltransferase [Pelagicoccus albus]
MYPCERRSELLDKLTIGISAYNNWPGLKLTLQKLVEVGLGDVKMVIVDDGSKKPIDFDLSEFPMDIVFKRYEESRGCVFQRNNIGSMVETDYYLSIDDDAYPVNGDICDVIESMEKDLDISVMALDVRGPKDSFELHVDAYELREVRYFVLCGCLIRTDHFKKSGGFQNPDELGWIYNEELDYSIRCWRDGHKIVLDRRFVLVHDRELVDGEDSYKSNCYARGLGYLHGRYFTGAVSLYKFLKMPFMLALSCRTRPFWLSSLGAFIKSYRVGVEHRTRDSRIFRGKDLWKWDRLDLPPFA